MYGLGSVSIDLGNCKKRWELHEKYLEMRLKIEFNSMGLALGKGISKKKKDSDILKSFKNLWKLFGYSSKETAICYNYLFGFCGSKSGKLQKKGIYGK